MDRLKKYTLAGFLFVLAAGSAAHFVYGWSGENPLLAAFFPVNESTWEHMKLVFFPALLFGLFLRFRLGGTVPALRTAVPAGILAGTWAVPVLFYTYTGILGFHVFWLDLTVFAVSALTVFLVIRKAGRSPGPVPPRFFAAHKILCALVVLMAAAFVVFTYAPPEIGLFQEPGSHLAY